jgi:hypothetical protein
MGAWIVYVSSAAAAAFMLWVLTQISREQRNNCKARLSVRILLFKPACGVQNTSAPNSLEDPAKRKEHAA